MYIWGSEFLKNDFHVHARLCKNIYWTMCTGGNHSWLCNQCTYGSWGSLEARRSLSRLCVGGNYIPTLQSKHDAVEGVWGSVIIFLSQVLRKVYGSRGLCLCISGCIHMYMPIGTVGEERSWGHSLPLENFVPDMEASFHFLLFCGFYFW